MANRINSYIQDENVTDSPTVVSMPSEATLGRSLASQTSLSSLMSTGKPFFRINVWRSDSCFSFFFVG